MLCPFLVGFDCSALHLFVGNDEDNVMSVVSHCQVLDIMYQN